MHNGIEERALLDAAPRRRSRRPATPRAPRRRGRRPPTAAAPAGHRGSIRSTARRACSRRAPRPPRRDRRATTATSANVQRDRRRGLCTTTSTACTRSSVITSSAISAATVSIRLRGGPADDVGGPLGQRAVVEGVGQVVAGRRGGQVDPHRDVDDEVLAVAALVVEHPVVAANGQAAQLDSISHRSPRPSACRRTLQRVDRRPHVVHPHAPRAVPARPARRSPRWRSPGRPAAAARRRRRRAACRGSACATRRPAPGCRSPTNSGSACSSAQLCCAVLAKPRPGIDDQLRRVDARGHRGVDAGQQFVAHLGDHVAVGGHLVRSVGADRAPVHQHPRHSGVGDHAGHVRVGAAAGHVVDDLRAVLQRRPRDLGVHGVDADRDALVRQAL